MTTPHRKARGDPLGLVTGGEGVITGTVVCAAAIAYAANYVDSIARLTIVILGTVSVYWLAHLHAQTIGNSLTHRHHPLVALRRGVSQTWPILAATVLPIGVLLLASLLGADLSTAAWAALLTTIALLTGYSYLAGARGGLDTWGRVASAAAGAGLGILVAVLKVALH